MITQSPYEPVAGTFYFLDNNYRGKQLTLKINPNESAAAALPKIEAVLKNPKVQQIE